MNNFDDILKKSFEIQSLENEAWLEPKDSVLGAIHSKLNNKEEKERKFLWVWLSGIIGFIIITSGLVYIYNSNFDSISQENEKLESILLPSKQNNNVSSDNAIIASGKETESKIVTPPTQTNAKKNSNIENGIIESENEIENYNEATTPFNRTNGNNYINAEKDISEEKNTIENQSKLLNQLGPSIENYVRQLPSSFKSFNPENEMNSNSNIISTIDQKLPVATTQPAITHTANNTESGNLQERYKSKSLLPESMYIDKLPLQTVISNTTIDKDKLKLTLPAMAIQPLKKKKETLIEFSGGLLFWNDQLNTNYQSALSPADFENGNDYGYQIGLAFKKEVISKLSAGVRFSYSQNENRSGHNAVLNYDEGQEVNGENSYDNVQLATPYGFVSSKFNIRRALTAEPSATLNSSINSKHQLKLATLESLLSFNVINLQKFSLNVEANLGYNYLINLSNQLDFIDTKRDDFNYTNGEILVDQNNLSNGFWSTGLSIDLNYVIQSRTSIGINYGFREALGPLFSSGDFSSSPRTQQLNIIFRRKF